MSGVKQPPAAEEEKRPFQFGLSTLFAVMFTWAVFCAMAATFGLGRTISLAPFGAWGAALTYAWRHKRREWASRLVLAFFVCVVFSFAMWPSTFSSRTTTRRMTCAYNLNNIALAMTNYEANHGCLPPAYIADESGKPMHSWRVLLLPYLDRKDLYRKYDFDEPWDGPNNSKLHDAVMQVFVCPSDAFSKATATVTDTSYVVVVGPGTMFPGGNSLKVSDAADGASDTVMLVEVANSGIHWMEPRDLHVVQMAPGINPKTGQGISSEHDSGANVATVDGCVHFLYAENFTPEQLQALLTRDGGEEVDIDGP